VGVAMTDIFDIFLLETILNGLLLGGVLALLALGLNLVFGVIDVVWICYAELIMIGMYTVYYLHVVYQVPLVLACAAAIVVVAACGAALHHFVIRPVLAAEPINQLLVTGGVLFFMQAAATLAFGVEFRNLGLRLPIVEFKEMYFSFARILAFVAALAGMVAVYLFLTRTFTGTAIRAISQDRAIMPLMGVNPARIYLVTSAIGGALAGLGACLLVLQYDVHPAIGLSFGPITFMICVMGGLGNMVGGFIAAFIFAQFISVGGFFLHLEWGYAIAFLFFIAMMFWKPRGLFTRSD
jgi:branched-chain amino acid transport system permease protein